ncbi:MAG: hypothetical protein WA395_15690 [Nitrososphaeraceae archaeon]
MSILQQSPQQQQQLSRIYYALYHNQNRIIEITKTEWTIRSASENIIFNIYNTSKIQGYGKLYNQIK